VLSRLFFLCFPHTCVFVSFVYVLRSDELGFGTPAAEARAGPTVVRHHGILPCPLLSTGTFSNGPVFVVLGGYVLLCRIPGNFINSREGRRYGVCVCVVGKTARHRFLMGIVRHEHFPDDFPFYPSSSSSRINGDGVSITVTNCHMLLSTDRLLVYFQFYKLSCFSPLMDALVPCLPARCHRPIQASVTGFFTFFAVFSMFQIISEGVGACCAVATRTPTSSVILLTFVLLVLLAFSGFLTTTVPVYFRWIHKVSYLTYAFSALVEREFSHVTFYDDTTGEAIPGVEAYPASLRTGLSYSQNVGILAGQVGGMEVVKFLAFNLAYRMNLI
ncbi:hypothetical protein Vretifemale_14474, partial [Volvox reticuliferus]